MVCGELPPPQGHGRGAAGLGLPRGAKPAATREPGLGEWTTRLSSGQSTALVLRHAAACQRASPPLLLRPDLPVRARGAPTGLGSVRAALSHGGRELPLSRGTR